MVLAWENLVKVFVMLDYFTGGEVIPHPSVSYRRVFTPILNFQPSSSQSDSRHFQCNFSRQEHPIQDLPLCLPSKSCPFRLTHGFELLMFEL